ncbi:MAG: hypothetical protein QXR30_02510 [Candidatus Woesearchaeota archaeon]
MNFYKKFATGLLSLGALASLGFSKINDQKLAKWIDQAIQRDVAEYQVYGDYKPNNIEVYFRNLGVSFNDMTEAYSKLSPVLVSDVYSFENSLSALKDIEEIEKIKRRISDALSSRIVFINSNIELIIYKREYEGIKQKNDFDPYSSMKLPTELNSGLSKIEDKIKSLELFVNVGFYEFVNTVEANEKKYGDSSPWLNRLIANQFGRVQEYFLRIDNEKKYLENFKNDTYDLINYFRGKQEYVKNLLNIEKLVGSNQGLIKKYEEIVNGYDSLIRDFESIVSRTEKDIRKLEDLSKSFPDVQSYIKKYNTKADELAKKITIPDSSFLKEMEQRKTKILNAEMIREDLDQKPFKVGYALNKILPSLYLNFSPIESQGIYIEGKLGIKQELDPKDLFFYLGLGRMSKSDIIIYDSKGNEYLRIQPATGDWTDILNYFKLGIRGNIYNQSRDMMFSAGAEMGTYGWPTKDRDGFIFSSFLGAVELKVYEFSLRFEYEREVANLPYINKKVIYGYDDIVDKITLTGRYTNENYSLFGGIFSRTYAYTEPWNGIDYLTNYILLGTYNVDISKTGGGLIVGGDYYLDNLVLTGYMSIGHVLDEKRDKRLISGELYFKAANDNFFIISEFDFNSGQIKSVNVGWKF